MKSFFFINTTKKILIIFLVIFSILINQHYGNLGVFPADSFSHFDSGYRILLGEYPFKDYWIVSGPLIDYIQAVFFYFFGTNWQSYVFHASVINAILTVATFLILIRFHLNIYYSFFYSLLFSVLAYTSSGTPFVDHHSALFSLLAIYSLMLAIKDEKRIYWYLLPVFLGLAFLSKQVPSSYAIISVFIILFFFSLFRKKYYWIKYCALSSAFFIIFLLIFGKMQGISLISFLEQYILYPQTIRIERIQNMDIYGLLPYFTFNGLVNHFKFIYICFIPITYINLKKLLLNRSYLKEKDFFYFSTLILFAISLIFHQILTKNQTFVFFIIPLVAGFSHISLYNFRPNLSRALRIILIIICIFITVKYHLRFNEGRKFHELGYVDFQTSSKAEQIDKKFNGLKWITPEFSDNPQKEILLINKIKLHLLSDNRTKMLISNYSFFSVILNEKLFSPSRWHLLDGTDYPIKGNKYFKSYKDLIINLIKKNNIKVIYTIYPIESSAIYTYIDKSCFIENKISEALMSYEVKNCYEFND